MPNINLIQEQRAISRKNELRARIGFFSFVGITFISVGAYAILFLEADAQRAREASLQAELQRLEPIKKQIEVNRGIESELQPRLASLTDAQQLTDRWVHILDHFVTQTPPNTWMTNVRSAGSDPSKGVSLTLTGLSTGQQGVGEFMLRTQNEKNLENVTLKFTKEKPTLAGPAIEFEMEAEVKGTAPDKTKEEEDK
jgi:Tfp pilus assembly protein PilN